MMQTTAFSSSVKENIFQEVYQLCPTYSTMQYFEKLSWWMDREMEWKAFGEDKAVNEGRTTQGKGVEIFRSTRYRMRKWNRGSLQK